MKACLFKYVSCCTSLTKAQCGSQILCSSFTSKDFVSCVIKYAFPAYFFDISGMSCIMFVNPFPFVFVANRVSMVSVPIYAVSFQAFPVLFQFLSFYFSVTHFIWYIEYEAMTCSSSSFKCNSSKSCCNIIGSSSQWVSYWERTYLQLSSLDGLISW